MSIVVVGFLAYDTVETPNGRVDEVLGGGASYFAIAARFFSPVSVVAVVGTDFKAEDMRLFTERNIDTRGIVKARRADDAMARPLSRRFEHARHGRAVAERARRLHAGLAA